MDRPLSFDDLLRPLLRHRGKAILAFVAMFCLAIVASLAVSDRYVSEARLFIRIGRATVSLDPTATVGQTLALSETREMELNSVVEVLGSRSLLEEVVDEFGPEVILKQRLPSNGPSKPPTAMEQFKAIAGQALDTVTGLIPSKQISPREQAVLKLNQSIGVEVAKKSAVIRVFCTAKSPELAQRLLDSVIDAFLKQHLRVNRSEGSYEFFEQQLQQNQQQLELASERLRDAKNSLGVVSIDSKRQLLQEKIGHIDRELLNAQTRLEAVESGVEKLKQQIAVQPERLNSQETNGFPNMAADSMRSELYRLQIRERELLAKYQDTHPLVVALRAQVREAKAIVDSQPEERVQVTSAINPIRQSLEKDLLGEQAELSTLKGQIAGLTAQRKLALAESAGLNDKEIHLAELRRDLEAKETSFRTYTEKLEQARINRSMEMNQLSNVNIAQPPSLSEKPTAPNRPLLLALGFVAAVCSGIGLAFLADQFPRPLRTAGEAERRLETPVLGTVPAPTAVPAPAAAPEPVGAT
jgi:uncharacterized protein involved in exopolysaccharide biosynthesis